MPAPHPTLRRSRKLRSAVNSSSGRSLPYSGLAKVFSPTAYGPTSPARNACVPHSDSATTRALGYADRLVLPRTEFEDVDGVRAGDERDEKAPLVSCRAGLWSPW